MSGRKRHNKRLARRMRLEALEQRLLYSADAAPFLVLTEDHKDIERVNFNYSLESLREQLHRAPSDIARHSDISHDDIASVLSEISVTDELSKNTSETVERIQDKSDERDSNASSVDKFRELPAEQSRMAVSVSVTTTVDTVDGDFSSISSLINNPGFDNQISLREAVLAANNETNDVVITLPAGQYSVTRLVVSFPLNNPDNGLDGDLDINANITLIGAGNSTGGTVISGDDLVRVLHIFGGEVTLRDLVIDHGISLFDTGGGIQVENGTLNLDNVTVSNSTAASLGGGINVRAGSINIVDSTFLANTAEFGAALRLGFGANANIESTDFRSNLVMEEDGGAILASGDLTISDSTFQFNTAGDDGSAIAIENTSTTHISSSFFEGNTTTGGSNSLGGGGTVINRGNLLLEDSYFLNNSANSIGGGVASASDATIINSTFVGNRAVNDGGALATTLNIGSIDVINSTFVNNSASGSGGAIGLHANTSATINHSTFVNNSVTGTGSGGAIGTNATGVTVAAQNSIFVGNSSVNGDQQINSGFSSGFNLFDDTPDFPLSLGDIANANAGLATLADNGSGIPTILLQPGSDAIDSGVGRSRTDANGVVGNGFVDIGATEFIHTNETYKVYWTDSNGNAVFRANADNSLAPTLTAVQQIASTSSTPLDIEFNAVTQQLFWVESNGSLGNVMISDPDGRNSVIALSSATDPGLLNPYGIALDTDAGAVYVTSSLNSGNDNGTGQESSIRKYTINGNLLNFDSVVVSSASSGSSTVFNPRDVEFNEDSLTGDQWLVWTDAGSTLSGSNGSGQASTVNALMVSGTDNTGFTIPQQPSLPAGLAWDGSLAHEDAHVFVADQINNLSAFEIESASADATQTISPLPTGVSQAITGIEFVSQTGLIWYTRNVAGANMGSVWTTDSSLSTHNIAHSSINTPQAIAVTTSNPPPAPFGLSNRDATVNEGSAVIIANTELNAVNPDDPANPLNYTVTQTTVSGRLELISNPGVAVTAFTQADIDAGNLRYVHDSSQVTSDQFIFTVSDGNRTSSPVTFDITVVPVNNVPVALDDSITTFEGGAVSGDLSINDSDGDGDTLTASLLTGPANGSVTVNGDGTFTYTHDGSETLTDSFVYRQTDPAGAFNDATVTVTVTPVNELPVVVDDSVTTLEGGVATGDLSSNDSDGDGDMLTASLVAGPANGTVTVNGDGTFTYTHDGSETLTDSFVYRQTDPSGAFNDATVTVTVTPVNDVPAVVDDSVTTLEGGVVTGDLSSNDSDGDGDTLTASLLTGPVNGTVTVNGDGTFTYTHDGSETLTDSFVYRQTDPSGAFNDATVTVTVTPVNDVPQAVDDSVTILEGGAVTGDLSVNDSDEDGDILTASLVAGAVNGTVTVNGDGTFTYTHDGSETLTDSFVYRQTDPSGAFNDATVTVTVTPVNDVPLAVDDSVTTLEGGAVTGDLSVNDSDGDGDMLTASLVTAPANGTVTVNGDGTFTYTHDGSEVFTDSFVYRQTDPAGAFNDATVTVTVTPVNDVPQVVDDSVTTLEGGAVTGDLSINDSDGDGDTLTASLVTAPANGTVTVNGDGTFTYTHDGSETLTDSFVYRQTDPAGAFNDATVTVTVTPVNDVPVVVNDSVTTLEGGFATGDLSINDSDGDGDMLTASLLTAPTNGTVTVNGDGTFTYTHDGSETLTDSFVYRQTDPAGAFNDATVTVTVTPVNDVPAVVDDSVTTLEGGAVTGDLSINDSDGDGDTLTASLVTAPANGTVTVNGDGTFTYTHNGSETLTDSFVYRQTDPVGAFNDATVTVTVTPVNDPPTAINSVVSISQGASFSNLNTGTLASLVNDPDLSDIRVFSLLTAPTFGSIVINPDGSFLYTHDNSESLQDSFEYQVTDAGGLTSSGLIEISIENINDSPVASNATITVNEGGIIDSITDTSGTVSSSLSSIVNDSDPDETLSFSLLTGPSNGTVNINPDGTFFYAHNGDESITDSFEYEVTDTQGASDTGTITLIITPENDSPVASNGVASVMENGSTNLVVDPVNSTSGTLAALISDADSGDTFTVTLVNEPVSGTVTINPDGSFIYTHDGSETLSDSFVYQIADSAGATDQGIIDITVTPVNDQPTVTNTISNQTVTESQNSAIAIPQDLFTDPDSPDLTIDITLLDGSPLPEWLTFDSDTGVLLASPAEANIGIHSLEVTAIDGQGGTGVSVIFSIEVLDISHNPELQIPAEIFVNENQTGSISNNIQVSDLDTPDTHELVVDDSRFEVVSNELRLQQGITLDHETEPQIQLEITVTDSAGLSVSTPITINVIDVNESPFTDQLGFQGAGQAGQTVVLPDTLFGDPDNDVLTFSVTLVDGSPLPPWFVFDPETLELSLLDGGNPTQNLPLLVTATDSQGEQATNQIGITYIATQQIPEPDQNILLAPQPAIVISPMAEEPITEQEQNNTPPAAQEPSFTTTDAVDSVQIVDELLNQILQPFIPPDLQTEVSAETQRNLIRDNEISDELNEPPLAQGLGLEPLESIFFNGDSLLEYDENFIRTIDLASEQIRDSHITIERIEQVSYGVTSSISIGYVLWLVRSGAVFASMLSALPAWRSIDPLPVLSSFDGHENEQDETLLDMVERKVKKRAPVSGAEK